jgi:hypothetical protein
VRDILSRTLVRTALILFALGLLVAAIAIGAYVVNFAIPARFSFATTDSSWSNFGSYVGGVLGPLFSFLAFVAVLFTVWLQAKQLEDSRTRAHLEELQRVLATIATNIDGLLAQQPSQIVAFANLKGQGHTVFSVLSAAGTVALSAKPSNGGNAGESMTVTASKEAIGLKASAIIIELHQLVWCLHEYERTGGSASVAKFYENRYNVVVCWLDALGLAESSSRVQAYFKPKEVRQFLVP